MAASLQPAPGMRVVAGTKSVPAVEKVFVILEVLARSQTGMTLRQLAGLCGLPKSSVHCIVLTLERRGYLYRNCRTSRYLFGSKLLMLADSAVSGLELRERAEPYLRRLARRTGLAAHLGILQFDEVLVVAKADFTGGVRGAGSWLGKRMELHCTAMGKALICHWGENELLRLEKKRAFSRHNDNTIWTLKRLEAELERVRAQGYAVDDEEDVLGLRCVGAPVYGCDGDVLAAMSVCGTTAEITAENLKEIAAEVRTGAGACSRELAA